MIQSGHTALITRASGGIGEQAARQPAARGVNLVLVELSSASSPAGLAPALSRMGLCPLLSFDEEYYWQRVWSLGLRGQQGRGLSPLDR